MPTIFDNILAHYKKQLPFVAYKKPESKKLSALFVTNSNVNYTTTYTEKGFVFAPFNAKEKSIIFLEKDSDFLQEPLDLSKLDSFKTLILNTFSNKAAHLNLVSKTIAEIKETDLKKIVVSRETLAQLSHVDIVLILKQLLVNYANAFVYVWYHPKVGLWFGATPETLLFLENNRFKTMSLAGTQLYKKDATVHWQGKELEEQQLVTNFIEHQLKPISNVLKINAKETIKAGNLWHLKTKVEGQLKVDVSLQKLITALHPTPAVCGLPRAAAKAFILCNEGYDRTFYTGFLGELNRTDAKSSQTRTSLFVNLRCMQIKDLMATVYVGGGITKDSNVQKEWLETVSKTKTILSVV